MINKYTGKEAVKFLGYEPAYGYHTTVYETGDFQTSRFTVEIKEYKTEVSIQIRFSGITPNGAAGPHGFALTVPKSDNWVDWVATTERLIVEALAGNFQEFPNPTQYNRSVSIMGDTNVRTWVADCGTAQDFAQKCFELNA